MTTVIKVENLGKKYLIGHEKQARYSTLRDSLSHGVKSVANRLIHPLSANAEETELEEFWALKDINFEVKQGDKVGIIGRNGAGKSTLLKILSRITAPTTGKITLKGRVASLLEVGTGFHPELSGRENIYLNGAILGMRKAEIKRKFDEIVAFAEVEKFLDTPVKRYSSGMYVRLAFAVAAHLEPEILIVDEVLAVGDAQFQKKCLGKMEEVGKEGRTVIFVSHNMAAVERLCNKGIVINQGHIILQNDNIKDIVAHYLNPSSDNFNSEWNNDGNFQDVSFTPQRLFLTNPLDGTIINSTVPNTQPISVHIEFDVIEPHPALAIGYKLYSSKNDLIYISNTTDEKEEKWIAINKGHNHINSIIPARYLNEGDYRLELICSLNNIKRIIEAEKHRIQVYFSIKGGLSDSPYWLVSRDGIMAPVMTWKSIKQQN